LIRQFDGVFFVPTVFKGYDNIGEAWKEELETPDLENFVFGLYHEVEPLYVMLHAVVRHKLYQKYGPTQIDPKGPIPIHLLGNMWGQDWTSLLELFPVSPKNINLDEKLQNKNLTVKEMVYFHGTSKCTC
jgi:peptidyl-dipeptidase A